MAVRISGSLDMYNTAKGIADHYWPWAVFLAIHLIDIVVMGQWPYEDEQGWCLKGAWEAL